MNDVSRFLRFPEDFEAFRKFEQIKKIIMAKANVYIKEWIKICFIFYSETFFVSQKG